LSQQVKDEGDALTRLKKDMKRKKATNDDDTYPLYIRFESGQAIVFDPFGKTPSKPRYDSGLCSLESFTVIATISFFGTRVNC
jgi:hypothetical protein